MTDEKEAVDLIEGRETNFDALQKIKNLLPDLPVILSSGFAEQDAFSQRKEEDFSSDGFLQKSFQLTELKNVVARVLAG